MYLPTRVKSGSSRFTCVLYAGLAKGGVFQLKVGVRLIRGCDLYPSIYGNTVVQFVCTIHIQNSNINLCCKTAL